MKKDIANNILIAKIRMAMIGLMLAGIFLVLISAAAPYFPSSPWYGRNPIIVIFFGGGLSFTGAGVLHFINTLGRWSSRKDAFKKRSGSPDEYGYAVLSKMVAFNMALKIAFDGALGPLCVGIGFWFWYLVVASVFNVATP